MFYRNKLSITFFIAIVFALFSASAFSLKAKVKTSDKQNMSYKGYIEASGLLLPQQQMFFYLSPGETVTSMNYSNGDYVNKGDVIYTASNAELLTKIAALEEKLLNIIKQKEQFDLLKIERNQHAEMIRHLKDMLDNEKKIEEKVPGYSAIDRKTNLEDELFRIRSKHNLIKAKLKYSNARIDKHTDMMALLQQSIDALMEKKEALTVRAPFAGKVRMISSHVSFLKPGEVIVELFDDSSYVVKTELWQHQLQYVSVGSKAEIYPDFYSEESIPAVVKSISPSVREKRSKGFSRFPVALNISNTNLNKDKFISGMTLSVRIFGNKDLLREE